MGHFSGERPYFHTSLLPYFATSLFHYFAASCKYVKILADGSERKWCKGPIMDKDSCSGRRTAVNVTAEVNEGRDGR